MVAGVGGNSLIEMYRRAGRLKQLKENEKVFRGLLCSFRGLDEEVYFKFLA